MSVESIWSLPDSEIETLRDSRVVLSMSGGKDSTACALILEKHDIEFERVFMDTGWEHPVLYEYIQDVLEPRFGHVTKIKSSKYENGMSDLVKSRTFPSRRARFCTEELKIKPYRDYISSIDEPVVSVVGIRREESANRAGARRWDFDENMGCDVFRPLVDHSFDEVIQLHQEGSIPPNPLYLQGAQRVGCFPCIFSRKKEIVQVADIWPGRIDQIEKLEEEVTAMVRERRAGPEKEKTARLSKSRVAFESVNKRNRNLSRPEYKWGDWLRQTKGGGLEDAEDQAHAIRVLAECDDGLHSDERRKHETESSKMTFFGDRGGSLGRLGIRELVKWARTDRGGRQFKLFDATAEDGCVRWGMCESPLADSELVKIRESNA